MKQEAWRTQEKDRRREIPRRNRRKDLNLAWLRWQVLTKISMCFSTFHKSIHQGGFRGLILTSRTWAETICRFPSEKSKNGCSFSEIILFPCCIDLGGHLLQGALLQFERALRDKWTLHEGKQEFFCTKPLKFRDLQNTIALPILLVMLIQ